MDYKKYKIARIQYFRKILDEIKNEFDPFVVFKENEEVDDLNLYTYIHIKINGISINFTWLADDSESREVNLYFKEYRIATIGRKRFINFIEKQLAIYDVREKRLHKNK